MVSQEKVGWPVMAAWAPRHLGGITGVCSLPSGTLVAAVVRRGGAQPALLGQFWGSIRRVQRVPAVTVRMLKVLERVVRGGWGVFSRERREVWVSGVTAGGGMFG